MSLLPGAGKGDGLAKGFQVYLREVIDSNIIVFGVGVRFQLSFKYEVSV